jgi:hypothetical protein
VLVAGACWMLLAAAPAGAESSLRLPYPAVFGTIPASTYDANHKRVGEAHLVIEDLGESRVRLVVESGIDGGARTVASAVLESVDDGRFLKLVKEESRSFDADGVAMGVMSIDHEAGTASCNTPRKDGMTTETIDLPSDDRVANVPLNLLFRPLVEGTTEGMTFQLLLCRFGARLVDIDAHIASRENDGAGNSIIEVEYQPNFGGFVSLVAKKWIPKLSIWFDSRGTNQWVAHRIPLYSKGPEVFVVRDGLPVGWLGRLR